MGGAVSTAASVDPPPKSPARFQRIPDTYETYEELQRALRAAGLESSSLIIGIDYTKSNTWTGEKTFRGKCLHDIDPSGRTVNPYQHVIEMMGRTLETFDDDKLIPVFGFGDASTGGSRCFPFLPDNHACHTFAQVLARYNQITPGINLAGPTNFAPIIREAIRICRQLRTYHILVIIADGHVNNQEDTVNAIVEASAYPISIVMVGVGDGPWDIMEHFDDFLPARRFDNFQFVEYHKMLKCNPRNPDVGFATAALMEVPAQYKLLREARLL
ncbi:hypothetical protein H310_12298 [Aphanomyces invadans]|uniref:VWFA domain-containing protein n=1 Tax=Aphanomyces invadans TaxID=157072 RepID=A0A024TKW9_9STRA|nr:hypothetical protein H310_12298 [Aphanomyces invadans]ETV93967.1 hypothetical protein H310_12298 [Aphanomyces invadans]|eukprot:XP_008877527.1 hypothetical protein H310_12298 [Aphanomyces invadans]